MREYVALQCEPCGARNYITSRQTGGGTPRLSLNKYCKHCRKHTKHAERRKK